MHLPLQFNCTHLTFTSQGLTVQAGGAAAQLDAENLARYRDANMLVLRAVSDHKAYGYGWSRAVVNRALFRAPEEVNRYNLDAFDVLVRNGFVNLADYDKVLATEIMAVVAASSTNEHFQVTFTIVTVRFVKKKIG